MGLYVHQSHSFMKVWDQGNRIYHWDYSNSLHLKDKSWDSIHIFLRIQWKIQKWRVRGFFLWDLRAVTFYFYQPSLITLCGGTYVWPPACRRQWLLPGRSWLCRCTHLRRSCTAFGSRGSRCPGWRSDETWGRHQWSFDFSAIRSLAVRGWGDSH